MPVNELLLWLGGFAFVIFAAIIFLKGFDRMAGRGPKHIKDGVEAASPNVGRIPCPFCAEAILPAAKICPHCRSDLTK